MAINPTLRAECEGVLPSLERAKEPASQEEILSVLVRHAPHYGVTAKGPSEWGALFGAYLDALDGLPVQAVEEGFVRWNRGEGHKDIRMAGFFPKAPQLYLLAEAARSALYMAAYRAKKALEYQEARPQVWTAERRAEERRKAIAAGVLKPDGSLNLPAPKSMPFPRAPGRTPHQMAAEMRQMADAVGDVI